MQQADLTRLFFCPSIVIQVLCFTVLFKSRDPGEKESIIHYKMNHVQSLGSIMVRLSTSPMQGDSSRMHIRTSLQESLGFPGSGGASPTLTSAHVCRGPGMK